MPVQSIFQRPAFQCAAGRMLGAVALGLLSACAQMPVGPSVAVMPAPNKPFDVFIEDDTLCRAWAARNVGSDGQNQAANQMAATTVTGVVLGALAGAAIDGNRGAGNGAAAGLILGAGVGANQGNAVAWNAQVRYDGAYQQCMYAKGNVVPGYYPAGVVYSAAPNPPPPPPPQAMPSAPVRRP